MRDEDKTPAQLIQELQQLRRQVAEWQTAENERRQADETLRRQNEYLAALHETTLGLVSRLDLAELLEAIVTRAAALVGTSHGYIYLLEPDQNEMRLQIGIGIQSDSVGHRVKPGEGIAGHVMQTGQPLVVDDYKNWPGRPPGFERSVLQAAVGVPLKSGPKVVGVIGLAYLEPDRRFGPAEIEILSRFAELASIALDNARLFRQTQAALAENETLASSLRRRAIQLQTAAEVSRAATSILDLDELLPRVVELIRERFDLYYVGIFLVDAAGRHAVLRAGTGQPGRQMLAAGHKLQVGGASMIGWCVANAQARIALDVGQDAVRFSNPWLPDTRSELALPLSSRERVIGAMTVQSAHEAAFSDEDITTLQTMADQVANAIENARFFQERQRRITELSILNEIGRAFSASLELDDLLQAIYRQVGRVFDATNFFIATYVEGSPEWTMAFQVEHSQPLPPGLRRLGLGFTSYILSTRQPVLLNSTLEMQTFVQAHHIQRLGPPAKSWMGVPLIAAGRIVGAMAIQSYEQENLYTDQDLALFSTIASQAAIAIQNARLFSERKQTEESLRRQNEYLQTLHDTTLGLMGRLSLTELLQVIITRAGALLGTDHGYIYLLEPGGAQMRARVGLGIFSHIVNSPLQLGQGLSGQVWQTGQPVIVEDYRAWSARSTVGPYDMLRAVAAVPLKAAAEGDEDSAGPTVARARDRLRHSPPDRAAPQRDAARPRIIGVLGLAYLQQDRTFGETEIQFLNRFAELASLALDNARLFDEIRKRTEQTQLLMRVSETAASTLDSVEVMRRMVREATHALGADMAGAYLPDETGKKLRPVAGYHVPPELREFFLNYHPALEGNPFVEQAFKMRQTVFTSDVANDPRLSQDIRSNLAARSALLTPMIVKDTVVGGMWLVWWKEARRFVEQDLRLVEGVVRQAAVAVENARLFGEVRERAERERQARALLATRVQELDCLNDIGRKINETPPVPQFLAWAAGRIPAALRYPDLCRVAIEFDGQTYGAVEAMTLPRHMVGSLQVGSDVVGRIYVAYTEPHDFLNEESALLGDIGRRISGYIENRRLFEQTQAALADQQRARALLSVRVRELDCLSDIGRKISEAPPVAELLEWVTGRIPTAMQYPDLCRAAIEFESRIYGDPEAMILDCQMIGDLQIGGDIVGQVYVAYTEPRELIGEESTLLDEASRRISGYIENRRLFEQTRLRAEELAILNDLSRSLAARLSVAEVLEEAYRGVLRLVDTRNFYISLYNSDKNEISFPCQVADGKRIEPEGAQPVSGLTGYLIRTRTPLLLQEKLGAEAVVRLGVEYREFAGKPDSLCWLGVPMIVGERVLGTIAVLDYENPMAFDQHTQELLAAVANQVAIALQNAYLFEDIRARSRREQTLRELTARVRASADPDVIVLTAVRELGRALGRPTFIRLGSADQLAQAPPAQDRGAEGGE